MCSYLLKEIHKMELSVSSLKHQLEAVIPGLTQEEAFNLANKIIDRRLPADDHEGEGDLNLYIQNGEIMLA